MRRSIIFFLAIIAGWAQIPWAKAQDAQSFVLKDEDIPVCAQDMALGESASSDVERFHAYLNKYQFDEFEVKSERYKTHYEGDGHMPASIERYTDLWVEFNHPALESVDLNVFQQEVPVEQNFASISDFLPPFVKQRTNKEAHQYGNLIEVSYIRRDDFFMADTVRTTVRAYPNCCAAVLDVYGLNVEKNRLVTSSAFYEKLIKDFEIIDCGEHVRFGDIMVIFRKRYGYLDFRHTAIVINKDFVWSKPTDDPEDEWSFERIETYFLDFYLGRGGRRFFKWKFGENSFDNSRVVFFRRKQ